MALHLKDLVIAIATVTGKNVTLSISTTAKVIEASLIAVGQATSMTRAVALVPAEAVTEASPAWAREPGRLAQH